MARCSCACAAVVCENRCRARMMCHLRTDAHACGRWRKAGGSNDVGQDMRCGGEGGDKSCGGVGPVRMAKLVRTLARSWGAWGGLEEETWRGGVRSNQRTGSNPLALIRSPTPVQMLLRKKKAAGRGLRGLRRSSFDGACDFSCCVKPRAGIDYTRATITLTRDVSTP